MANLGEKQFLTPNSGRFKKKLVVEAGEKQPKMSANWKDNERFGSSLGCYCTCLRKTFLTLSDHVKPYVIVSDLGVDNQEGDHSVFFQVGVSALSISRLHLV